VTADTPKSGPLTRPSVDPDGDDPVLPAVSRDDSDEGWGDRPSRRDAEWYERERPPHHE
jgi:hypothetical protein